MSNRDKLKDLPKFLKNVLPYVDDRCEQHLSMDLRKVNGEWTIHNFKLRSGEPE